MSSTAKATDHSMRRPDAAQVYKVVQLEAMAYRFDVIYSHFETHSNVSEHTAHHLTHFLVSVSIQEGIRMLLQTAPSIPQQHFRSF